MTKTDIRVAYKPLGMSAPSIIEEDTEQGEEEEEDENGLEGRSLHYSPFTRRTTTMGVKSNSRLFFGLADLRLILYIVATILFLIFLFSLTTHQATNNNPTGNSPSAAYLKSDSPIGLGEHHLVPDLHSNIDSRSAPWPSSSDNRPKYDNYLSSLVHSREKDSASANQEPFDDLQYPEYEHSSSSSENDMKSNFPNSSDSWWTIGTRLGNEYVTVTNYIRAMKSFNYNSSITLTTQATTEFIYHTLELCKRWDGPISVAIFCPGPELKIAITLVKFLRQCLSAPLSACIRDKVSWHLVYNRVHGAPASEIGFPRQHLDSINYPQFAQQDQCPKLAGPSAVDFIRQFESDLKLKNDLLKPSYRQQFQLLYPINIGRNIARLAATTKHILASDIELYPSVNLVPQFINYIKNHNVTKEFPGVKKYVFTLPIFEVKANVSAPKTKPELIQLFEKGDAIFFHKWVCDACQNFPNRLDWLQVDKFNAIDEEKAVANDNEVAIFEKTRRDNSRAFWEPIFIGTNEDPLFDDRLTWDGRRDKMGQMYEMCLLDYHLFVLGNAFLIHAPGIKHFDGYDYAKRLKYIKDNNFIYDKTIARLKKQYENSANINKC